MKESEAAVFSLPLMPTLGVWTSAVGGIPMLGLGIYLFVSAFTHLATPFVFVCSALISLMPLAFGAAFLRSVIRYRQIRFVADDEGVWLEGLFPKGASVVGRRRLRVPREEPKVLRARPFEVRP